MKCIFLIVIALLLFSCSAKEPDNATVPDFGLLILQRRMDSMEKRLDSVEILLAKDRLQIKKAK